VHLTLPWKSLQEYEQALQLRAFAARIDKKLGHIPIVAQVVQSVDASASTMVNQLLAQLKAPVQVLNKSLQSTPFLPNMIFQAELTLIPSILLFTAAGVLENCWFPPPVRCFH